MGSTVHLWSRSPEATAASMESVNTAGRIDQSAAPTFTFVMSLEALARPHGTQPKTDSEMSEESP